ncbi:MAG: hypothetical protein NC924_00125 [Candidatus Omnitrophica bacterium]|nr:hypothetical protein [Candidatus Omnitrophota bacterium]
MNRARNKAVSTPEHTLSFPEIMRALAASIARAHRILSRRYSVMLPGIVAFFIVNKLSPSPEVAFFLSAGVSTLSVAGAARALRIRSEAVMDLWRAGALIHLYSVFAPLLAFFLFLFFWTLLRSFLPIANAGMPFLLLSGISVSVGVIRLWPAYAAVFLWRGQWVPGRYWAGTRLATVWRITGKKGVFLRFTLPLFLCCAILVSLYCVLGLTVQASLPLRSISELTLFLYMLPLLHILVVDYAGRLYRFAEVTSDA